ncbi:hypothetical protein F5Y00DRAFT_267431 [Daldinia vernicosa]|uniref:uncharacterized protein n=1 Tax=Daldinia vernicosa TaxID=114800 RepID=UPI0020080E8B|nr:uncharacterized protein F5Y00DRAFT_267431 [Daldinia vernicosa]KAI0854196.1 hypothetical protein F5Y00DRAFT_267431 [Daldinia vernicosa]
MGDSSKGKSKERDNRQDREGRSVGRQVDPYDPRYMERTLAENRARCSCGDTQACSAPRHTRDPGPYGSSQAAYNASLLRPADEVSPERRDLHDRVTGWMQTPSFPDSAPPTGQQQYASPSSATSGFVAGPSTTAAWPTDPNTMAPSDVASHYNKSDGASRQSSRSYNPSNPASLYDTGPNVVLNERRMREEFRNRVIISENPNQRRREQEKERKEDKRRGKERAQ